MTTATSTMLASAPLPVKIALKAAAPDRAPASTPASAVVSAAILALEDKDARFHRIAQKRMHAAIVALEGVGSLSNRSNYTYTTEEVRVMLEALQTTLNGIAAQFRSKGKSGKFSF